LHTTLFGEQWYREQPCACGRVGWVSVGNRDVGVYRGLLYVYARYSHHPIGGGTHHLPLLQTPLFVLNSKYDTWQAKQIIGAGNCSDHISTCPTDLIAFWVGYGHKMVAILDSLPPRHGAYLGNCQMHCQTGPSSWGYTVNGTSMGSAVATWYAAALRGEQATLPRHVDRCDELPCGSDVCHHPV
jgi:hypothetical protein